MRDDDLLPKLPERPHWHQAAACRGCDPDLFFPTRGAATKAIKAICARCPVRSECLDAALVNAERWGIWGGLSERARRKERRHIPVRITCRWCDVEFMVPPRQGQRGGPVRFCSDDCRRQSDNARRKSA